MTKTVDKVLGATILLAVIAALPLGFSVGNAEILSGVPGYIVSLAIVGIVLFVILVRAVLGQTLSLGKRTEKRWQRQDFEVTIARDRDVFLPDIGRDEGNEMQISTISGDAVESSLSPKSEENENANASREQYSTSSRRPRRRQR